MPPRPPKARDPQAPTGPMSDKPRRGERPAGRSPAGRPTGARPSGRPCEDAPRPSGLWLHGRHAIEAALANPARRIKRLLALPGAVGLLPSPLPPGAPAPEIVERDTLEALLPPGAVHQGLAASVAPLPAPDLDALAAAPGPGVIAVLDQVSDPHNVGAVLRSAAAFGLRAVVVQDRHSPEETGTLAKAACGALERVPLVRVANLSRCLEDLKQHGYWVAGLEAGAPQALGDAALDPRTVLVLGSEGSGLRRLVRDHCDLLVCLPMAGPMESLNVSNAAAIAFYDLAIRRQGDLGS
ncbi:23S rRNA (guanosine(2251)-2'-O)-methyltransferase RlmB [Pararhodospirillum photometricum]|uniref:RNA methyltransferase TrmH, group 3 n=1 Tax=Pararhodospirillum photometricum DSM 122 TaxID=1150469 RepID=H6SJH1_PARPM|nr:23S rRNA (guanosine(2251)-2'-O)-methyltransferase RlmB [Pararhodospirillum photometricum]CCG08136.1 RNA methyltransferase TrmH, group 3 [Pararhodospirillum photometricum DSM 122]